MAFGTVCKNTETQENEAWIIAGPTDGSTNIVHHDNDNNYQLLTGIDDQYGAGYTGITCCCKPLFNPATGLLTVDCACTTATCVDIGMLDNSGVNHPVLFQMYDSVNSELINKLGKSTSVMFNPNCYVCNDPDTGAQICKPVLYVSTICSDEYLGIAEPISYVNSLPVKPENKIYGIQESDTISSMTIKTLARTYFDFDSTNNVYVPKQNLIETDLTIGLSTDVDIQTINSSFTEVNGSIVVTPETTASGTLTLQRFYAGESTSCNYFKLGSGDGGSGTVEINRQSYTGYKLVASDANGENLRISGPSITADDNNFNLTISCENETLTESKSSVFHGVNIGCDSTHYTNVTLYRGQIRERIENDGTLTCTTKFHNGINTCVKSGDNINSVNDITCTTCREIDVYGAFGCSQFKSTADRTEIKTSGNKITSSISTNVNPEETDTWVNQESYVENPNGTVNCIKTQLLPKCDKPIWSSYFTGTGTPSSVAFCCDGKVYVNCDDTKGWKCLLNEDDVPDTTTICPSDANCEFPLTFYDYDNTTFLTSCDGKLTYNPASNTVEMGSGVSGKIHHTSCQPVGNGRSTNELIFCERGLFAMKQVYDRNSYSQTVCDVQISECCGIINLYAHTNSSQNLGSTTCANISGGYTHIDYDTGNNYCRVCGHHYESGAGMYLRTCETGGTYGQTFRACVDPDDQCPNPETFTYSFCDGTRNSAFKLCNCDGKMYVNCDSNKGWKCLLNEDDASSGGTYISWTNPTTSCVNSITTENGIVGQSYGAINIAKPGVGCFYLDDTCVFVDKTNIGSLQINSGGVNLDTTGGTLGLDQNGNLTLAVKTGCPGGAVLANRFSSDGTASISVGNTNEFNITPSSGAATWINYRGGSSNLCIGNGAAGLGTLHASSVYADNFSGRISMADGYCATNCNFMPYSGTSGVYGMGEGNWAHFLTFSHGSFDGYYGSAVQVPFFDSCRFTWRVRENGTLCGVHELLDNRGGQIVGGPMTHYLGEYAAGNNKAFVLGSNVTSGAGYNGGAYLGHLNANYDGYWGFATVGFYNAESGALTPNICMGREGYTWFNQTTFAPNAHVDTCLYGPYGKIDFATNNRIEIEPIAGSGGSVMWGPGQCGYYFINSSGEPSVYPQPGTNFIVVGTEVVNNNLHVCGTPYKLKSNAWCPLTSSDEVVPVATANGTTFMDNTGNTWFERCYGGHVASQVVMGNDAAYIYGSNGTSQSYVMANGNFGCIRSITPNVSERSLVVGPNSVYITASSGCSIGFNNIGNCDFGYSNMIVATSGQPITSSFPYPSNMVVPISGSSVYLGNTIINGFVGRLTIAGDPNPNIGYSAMLEFAAASSNCGSGALFGTVLYCGTYQTATGTYAWQELGRSLSQ